MSSKWTRKYGLAAVLVAIIVIGVVLFATQMSPLTTTQASSSYLVMLTDPPTVPAGTTLLNLTYSDVSLHVIDPNATTYWLPTGANGTVDLFSLINVSQTIASPTLPNGSTVDKIQFTVASVEAQVNGTLYPVTPLASTMVISIADSKVSQTLSGVLVDFNPTLVQIQATDSNGTLVNYYVLVPSATATVVTGLSKDRVKVGTIVELGQNDREKLVRVVEEFSKNVTIDSATLSLKGNVTNLSVNLTNNGNVAFRIFGLTLHGEFNATRTWETRGRMGEVMAERIHPDTIPFKVNDSSLIPLFGENHDDNEISPLILAPGQNVTLSFNDTIALQPDMGMMKGPAMVITPIVGNTYTLRLMGEGFETFNVNATSLG